MSVTKEQVIEFISNMSVLELSELIKELEEKFGVSAAAPVAAVAVAGTGLGAAAVGGTGMAGAGAAPVGGVPAVAGLPAMASG